MVNNSERLAGRDGLPEALRVLLAEYPREGWEADPSFGELIRFWLDRHVMFRRILAAMTERTEATADVVLDPRRFGAELSRLGSMFVGELHGHHSIEDHHYFPRLRKLDGRLDHGFDLLDADHHDLDAHLADFTGNANALLRDIAEGKPHDASLDTFLTGLGGTHRFLDRHLTDEEDLIVPVLLKHGSGGLA